MLLIDHQSGLFQTAHDMPFTTFPKFMKMLRTQEITLARVVQAGVVPIDAAGLVLS